MPEAARASARASWGRPTIRRSASGPGAAARALAYLPGASPNAPAFLILHVQRKDGIEQSRALPEALRKAGTTGADQRFPGHRAAGPHDRSTEASAIRPIRQRKSSTTGCRARFGALGGGSAAEKRLSVPGKPRRFIQRFLALLTQPGPENIDRRRGRVAGTEARDEAMGRASARSPPDRAGRAHRPPTPRSSSAAPHRATPALAWTESSAPAIRWKRMPRSGAVRAMPLIGEPARPADARRVVLVEIEMEQRKALQPAFVRAVACVRSTFMGEATGST